MVQPPRFPSFVCLKGGGGGSLTSCQQPAGRVGGRMQPKAHMTRASPSQRACFTTSKWQGPFHMTISPAWMVKGCSPAAVRVMPEWWWVHTEGACLCWGGDGVEDIVPQVLHCQNQMRLPPKPHEKKPAICGAHPMSSKIA